MTKESSLSPMKESSKRTDLAVELVPLDLISPPLLLPLLPFLFLLNFWGKEKRLDNTHEPDQNGSFDFQHA